MKTFQSSALFLCFISFAFLSSAQNKNIGSGAGLPTASSVLDDPTIIASYLIAPNTLTTGSMTGTSKTLTIIGNLIMVVNLKGISKKLL